MYYGGYMKRLSRYAVLLLAVCCLCPTVGEAQAAGSKAPRIVNRVAATVNGRPITSAEVRFMMAPYLRELSMLYPRQGPRFNAELLKVKKQVLDELIDRELVLGENDALPCLDGEAQPAGQVELAPQTCTFFVL